MELSFDVTLMASGNNHFRKNFVLRMRDMLKDPNNPSVDYRKQGTGVLWAQIPRLREQVDDPELMNLTLLGEEARVTLSVRTDNLYVVGFGDGQGRWFEFSHFNPDGTRRPGMIQGSTGLPFSGAYNNRVGIGELSENDNILGRLPVENAIRGLANLNAKCYDVPLWLRTLTTISEIFEPSFYRQTNKNAILHLAGYDVRTNIDHVKLWLRTLIVNFIEFVRFDCMKTGRDAHEMTYHPECLFRGPLNGSHMEMIRTWGNLSMVVMLVVNNQTVPFPPLFCKWSFDNICDVLKEMLGIALVPREFSACNGDDDSGAIGGGLTLAEVVGVVIRKIHNQNPGYLYGTITVTDGFGAFKLYNRDKDHYQEVGPRGKADLAYPHQPRAIYGADDFVIDVDLMHYFRWWFWDLKVAHGQVAWNSRDALSRDYNTILKVPVKAEVGEVEVQYAVMTDAVVAKVKVEVVDNGKSLPKLYGSVTARTTMASGEPLHYSLFDKARDEHVPLQRTHVSAPLCSELVVSVNLSDANLLGQSPDDQIANDSVAFAPRRDGTDTKVIPGRYRSVRVEVTWSFSI